MGAGASITEPVDKAKAQELLGDKFDDAKFDDAAVDGKVSVEKWAELVGPAAEAPAENAEKPAATEGEGEANHESNFTKAITAMYPDYKETLIEQMPRFKAMWEHEMFADIPEDFLKTWNSANVIQLLDCLGLQGSGVEQCLSDQEICNREIPDGESVINEMELPELENMMGEAEEVDVQEKMIILIAFRYCCGQILDISLTG